VHQALHQTLIQSAGNHSSRTQKPRKQVPALPLSCRDLILNFHSELWSIFHDELDLDGNGNLDANELAQALKKAGEQNVPTFLSPIKE
jgi:hypothetical protein